MGGTLLRVLSARLSERISTAGVVNAATDRDPSVSAASLCQVRGRIKLRRNFAGIAELVEQLICNDAAIQGSLAVLRNTLRFNHATRGLFVLAISANVRAAD